MNWQPTFKNIEKFSIISENNEFFTQLTNRNIPLDKNANSVLLKYSPTLEEFKIIEKIAIDHQSFVEQDHVKFCWPENTGIRMDVLEYIHRMGYHLGKSLLMMADPKDLQVKVNDTLKIKEVDSDNFQHFLAINYQEDLKINLKHAQTSEKYYHYQFQFETVKGLLAYSDSEPAGSVISVSSDHFLEIDNLLTVSEFRKMGVASTLIYHVKAIAQNDDKRIILTADAEDFPKDLYQKMGFNILASQIEIQKVISA